MYYYDLSSLANPPVHQGKGTSERAATLETQATHIHEQMRYG